MLDCALCECNDALTEAYPAAASHDLACSSCQRAHQEEVSLEWALIAEARSVEFTLNRGFPTVGAL